MKLPLLLMVSVPIRLPRLFVIAVGVPKINALAIPSPSVSTCAAVTVSELPSASVSFVNRLPFTGASSVTGTISFTATGASGCAATLTVTELADVNVPSVITYGKLMVPLKLGAGVKVITPLALTLTVPFVTLIICAKPGVSAVPLMLNIVGVVPSGSLSLNNKFSGTLLASSFIFAMSGCAIGASGAGLMVIAILAGVEIAPPLSVAVNGILTLPLKLIAGTKIRPAACAGVSAVVVRTGVMPSAKNNLPWLTSGNVVTR